MKDELKHLPLTSIDAPRISLRPVKFKAVEYVEMVESIRKDGVLQPILVRPRGDRHEIVEGWHRYEASKEAGREDIPCYIKEMTDEQVKVYQLKCQAIRPKTLTFEFARRLKLLMEGGSTVVELSQQIDKSPKWISDQLYLNRLCEKARPSYDRGEISMNAALALANLPMGLQDKYVDDAVAMRSGEFCDRAKEVLRDYKSSLLKTRVEDKKHGVTPPMPRAMNVIKREALKPSAAEAVLREANAKTPLDGWVACLQWVLKIDPLTVKQRLAGREERQKDADVRANREEWRKLNRDLIKKFIYTSGEEQHGE
jgi:ParB/RepB/Spo0J family partition protein